jgi:DNA-binding TFAR19-related protein (PDSD5 family)
MGGSFAKLSMNSTSDETEEVRRRRLAVVNSAVESKDPTTERQRLEAQYGRVWDIGSANLTDDAFNRNMELGMVVREAAVVLAIAEHFQELIRYGALSEVVPGSRK